MTKEDIEMLKLVNITKDYVTKGVPTVHALKGLTVNFRRNEFVAILGASGCGKTTLLNIIGGLDRYTSGDLIIEGKSTKDYSDRDWDTYRNHSIGFVFQSYNLIGHQSILRNVELALTISGIKKDERKRRAMKALETVGLEGMEKKKPNQLSGGQMQRVAIARALVNDPEILLADEPTGALDSETSVQIMDLLKEVASDRLVIMVTHNPDLANTYANRIVTMKDGLITSDANPYAGETKEELIEIKKQRRPFIKYKKMKAIKVKKGSNFRLPECSFASPAGYVFRCWDVNGEEYLPGSTVSVSDSTQIKAKWDKATDDEKIATDKGSKEKTSMSFFTATGLSFFNLLSKLKRTILITIAGSIGIIGVSSVLAVSHGVNSYVHHMQDDMLSQYPLQVAERSIDYSTLMSGLSSMNKKDISKFDLRTEVGLDSMIVYLMEKYKDFTSVKTNEINDDLLDFIDHIPPEHVSSISRDYGLDMTNNIFTKWQRDDSVDSQVKYMSLNGLTQMYISELKTVEGFAEYAIFVDLFTDFMKPLVGDEQYILSQYDLIGTNSKFPTGPNEIVLVVDENQTLTDLVYAQMGFYNEKDFLNIARKAIESQKEKPDQKKLDSYTYPEKYTIDDIIGKELVYCRHDDIWNYKEISNKTATFGAHIMNPSDPINPYKFDGVLSYDNNIDEISGTLTSDMAGMESLGSLSVNGYRVGEKVEDEDPFIGTWDIVIMGNKIAQLTFDGTYVTIGMDVMQNGIFMPISKSEYKMEKKVNYAGYMYDANVDPTKGESVKISGILKKKKNTQFGCLERGVYFTPEMGKKMMVDSIPSKIVSDPEHGIKAYIGSSDEMEKTYSAYVTYTYTSFKDGDSNPHYEIPGIARALNTNLQSSLSSMFSVSGTSNVDVDKAYLRSLCGLATKMDKDMSYYFAEAPEHINIYPKNFASKKKITSYLDQWNKEGTLFVNGHDTNLEDRKELTYTDTIQIIVNVINTLITTVTIALVAFTSLSLVVSCFMIAVITYISTMERVKEIGIIRSLGGRKKDISRLFIAECLIIGLSSGVFGIAMTYVLATIFNLVIMGFGVGNMAILTIPTALIMIGVSVVLNVLSGLIPALRASSQDPVVALRTE